ELAAHRALAVVAGEDAVRDAVPDDVLVRRAGLRELVRQRIHARVALVADDEAALPVEHAEALAHVVERGVEADVLRRQAGGGALALAELAAVQDRERKADAGEREEETGGERVAFVQEAAQEGAGRNVDDEGA